MTQAVVFLGFDWEGFMPEKICPCCKKVIDLRDLPSTVQEVEGLVYFQCDGDGCEDTLTVKAEVLKNMLLNNAHDEDAA